MRGCTNHNSSVNGLATRVCVVCKRDLPLTEYLAAEGFVRGRMDECKQCYGRRVEERNQTARMQRHEAKQLVAAGKDRPCADCGNQFPLEAMEYDHVPGRGEKLFNLSAVPLAADALMVRREMSKCDVVCANCHRIRTTSRKGQNVGRKDALERLQTRVLKYPYLDQMLVADRIARREREAQRKPGNASKFRREIGPQVMRRRPD